MQSYSQATQDIFVLAVTNKKRNGTFVEIGSNHPIQGGNNTYLLERDYYWTGVLVEYDSSFEELYKLHRKNSKYIIGDARTIDYKSFLDSNAFPKNIDYLQIDLDVNNRSTLDTLELLDRTIFDTYTFASITFEHDIYTGDFFSTREQSRNIFKKRGYILVFPDVKVSLYQKYFPFEDWYVHPSIVDMNYIESIRSSESLSSEQIRKILSTKIV